MVANAWVRPGNTADSSNCEAFVQETLHHALAGQRVGSLLADSGFYTESILNILESELLNYLIATRLYPNVKRQIYGLDDWTNIYRGIEVTQMHFSRASLYYCQEGNGYTPQGWR